MKITNENVLSFGAKEKGRKKSINCNTDNLQLAEVA